GLSRQKLRDVYEDLHDQPALSGHGSNPSIGRSGSTWCAATSEATTACTVRPARASREAPTTRATTYAAKLIAEMKKLVGQAFTSDNRMPPSAEANETPTLIAIAATGRAVRRVAAAAGVMTSVRTSSTPTTCTASAVVSATSRSSITDSKRSDTPRASAASGSTLANTSGQNVAARTAR